MISQQFTLRIDDVFLLYVYCFLTTWRDFSRTSAVVLIVLFCPDRLRPCIYREVRAISIWGTTTKHFMDTCFKFTVACYPHSPSGVVRASESSVEQVVRFPRKSSVEQVVRASESSVEQVITVQRLAQEFLFWLVAFMCVEQVVRASESSVEFCYSIDDIIAVQRLAQEFLFWALRLITS